MLILGFHRKTGQISSFPGPGPGGSVSFTSPVDDFSRKIPFSPVIVSWFYFSAFQAVSSLEGEKMDSQSYIYIYIYKMMHSSSKWCVFVPPKTSNLPKPSQRSNFTTSRFSRSPAVLVSSSAPPVASLPVPGDWVLQVELYICISTYVYLQFYIIIQF